MSEVGESDGERREKGILGAGVVGRIRIVWVGVGGVEWGEGDMDKGVGNGVE